MLLPTFARAQKSAPDPAAAALYECRENLLVEKIFREHIPLDGAEVPAILFRKDSLYGFVDKRTRKRLVAPQFTQVFAVYKEGAIVESESEGYGLVDYNGHFLIPPVFENLFKEDSLYHGMSYSHDKNMPEAQSSFIYNAYYSESGQLIYQFRAHDFHSFEDGESLAWYRYGPKYTIFNHAGKELSHFDYKAGTHFLGIFNNILVSGVEDAEGNVLYSGRDLAGTRQWEVPSDSRASAVFRMSDNLFAFITEETFSLMDKAGKQLPYGIQNEWIGNGSGYNFALFNNLELIPVQDFESHKTGFIDKTGRLVIPCRYAWAGSFENGEAPYLDSNRDAIGFIDTKGRPVVPEVIPADNLRDMAVLGERLHFQDGLCKVEYIAFKTDSNGRRYIGSDEGNRLPHISAYIDHSGHQKLALPDTIMLADNFSDGLAPVVTTSGKLGFIDTSGRMVIAPKYELAVQGSYPFPQAVVPRFINGYAYIKAFKGYIGKDGYEYFSGKRVEDHYDFSH